MDVRVCALLVDFFNICALLVHFLDNFEGMKPIDNPYKITAKFVRMELPTRNGIVNKLIDTEDSVRLYRPLYECLDEFIAVEMSVLSYICTQLRKHSDEVYLDAQDILNFLNRYKNGAPPLKPIRSRSYVYRGINMLVERGIIAKKEGKVYYINPNMLFRGSRVNYVTDIL